MLEHTSKLILGSVLSVLTCRRASMEDLLAFDEKEREQEMLQKRLLFEKKVLTFPVVPHISHTTAKNEKINSSYRNKSQLKLTNSSFKTHHRKRTRTLIGAHQKQRRREPWSDLLLCYLE